MGEEVKKDKPEAQDKPAQAKAKVVLDNETVQTHKSAIAQIRREQEWNKKNREKHFAEQKKAAKKPAPNPGLEGKDTTSGAPSPGGDAVGAAAQAGSGAVTAGGVASGPAAS